MGGHDEVGNFAVQQGISVHRGLLRQDVDGGSAKTPGAQREGRGQAADADEERDRGHGDGDLAPDWAERFSRPDDPAFEPLGRTDSELTLENLRHLCEIVGTDPPNDLAVRNAVSFFNFYQNGNSSSPISIVLAALNGSS